MFVFEFGITLLHLTGIKPWNISVWWKKFLSYFYMFHIPFGLFYFCAINLIMIIISSRNNTYRTLEFLWRASGVFTLLAQTLLLVMQGTKLKKVFDMPEGVKTFDLNPISMKKRINFKLYCYVGGILTFMIAYLIRKYILKDLVNNGNGDVEYFLPNLISNKFLVSIIHIHTSVLLFQNFVVLFGHDFLFIYSLALIQAFLDHLKKAIRCMNLNQSERTISRQEVVRNKSSRYNIQYCVMLHTHIIQMSQTINSVFSNSILLLVWRAFTMSIAAFELTKRVDNTVTFVEIAMFLLISLLQLLTLCHVAQQCKDQGVSLSDVCLYKAWSDVIAVNKPKINGDRRSLLVMASRCSLPLTFNAGPFYSLSLDTFLTLIGLSFSYYMFFFSLKTMQ